MSWTPTSRTDRPRRAISGAYRGDSGRPSVAQMQERRFCNPFHVEILGHDVVGRPPAGKECPCASAPVDEDDGPMRSQARRRDGVRHVNAFGAELVKDLGAGLVISDPRDEGGVPAEAGDGDHRGSDHASALLKAPANGCPAFRWRNCAQKEQVIDTREADPEDARGSARGWGRGGCHERRG